jgi:hypothetical protein
MSDSISRPWSTVPALIAVAFAAAFGCDGSAPAFSPSCNDAATTPVPPTSPVCTRFARDTLFDAFIAPDFGGPMIGGMNGTGAADIYVAVGNGFRGQVARWNGSAWAFQKLPADAFSVSPITIDAAGEPWAVIAERGNSLSGVGGPSALIHRRAGAWTLEPKPPSRDLGPLGGTRSGLFVGTADAATGAFSLWGWQDHAWRESPVVPAPQSANRPSFGAYGFWGAGCYQALAFGGGATTDTLVAGLFRLNGASWVSVAVPPLSEIVAVSGPSLDELYVLALNRNQDGTSRIFHVTNGLQTWTLLPIPPTVDYTAVWSPGPSLAVAVGCEWPDKTVARAADCARITTFVGDTIASASLPGVEGDPVGLWHEPQTGALHLLTAAADVNGLLRGQHYVAPAQCP